MEMDDRDDRRIAMDEHDAKRMAMDEWNEDMRQITAALLSQNPHASDETMKGSMLDLAEEICTQLAGRRNKVAAEVFDVAEV